MKLGEMYNIQANVRKLKLRFARYFVLCKSHILRRIRYNENDIPAKEETA